MMKIALGLGFEQNEQDNEKLNRLKLITDYIINNYKKEGFPLPLNKLTLDNTTYDTLNNLFGKKVDEILMADDIEANSYDENALMNNKYSVIVVEDFETAHDYGQYSASGSKLCYTQDKNLWDGIYTAKGLNKVYLILDKNWKNIQEKHGENTPYDEYGLSMIFVFINPEGNIAYSNTRWNHDTNGNGPSNVDQSFTKASLTKLLGVNFNSIFKPYTDDELISKGLIPHKKVAQLLKKGVPLDNIFSKILTINDFLRMGELYGKWALIDNNDQLIGNGDLWFDGVDEFTNGFAPVNLNDKWSYIDTNGNLIGNGDLWFDNVDYFSDGFAKVKLNNKYSLINTNGELIDDGNTWFDNIDIFFNGFAKVKLNDKWSYIDTNNNLIGNGKLWFDEVDYFYNGLAKVKLNNKYSYINSNGELMGKGKLWFDYIYDFRNGFAEVELNDKYSFLNDNGKLIGDGKLWFDSVDDFHDGFAKVKLNNKWSFLNSNGELIGNGNLWFDEVNNFKHDNALVFLDGRFYYLTNEFELDDINDDIKYNLKKGRLQSIVLMFDDWREIQYDLLIVKLNNKWSLLNIYSGLIDDGNLWFDDISDFRNGFAKVELNNKYSFINDNGELIGDGKLWFDYVDKFTQGFADVELDYRWYTIDTNGNFYDMFTHEPIPNPFNHQQNEAYKSMRKVKINESQLQLIVENSAHRQTVNLDIQLPNNDRHAKSISAQDFEQKMKNIWYKYLTDDKYNGKFSIDNFVYRMCRSSNEYKELSKLMKDLSKIQHNDENLGVSGKIKTSGKLTYLQCYGGGDWESPILFYIYWDGKNFRGYIPTYGNAFNRITKSAFGNNEEADIKFLKQQGINGNDHELTDIIHNVKYDETKCLKDFKARVSVTQ